MKKTKTPEDITPCCAVCEHCFHIESTGEYLCKRKKTLKKVVDTDLCRGFSFDIFSYKPSVPKMPKAFDFTKI